MKSIKIRLFSLILLIIIACISLFGVEDVRDVKSVNASGEQEGAWYWGDSHTHSTYSDGAGTINQNIAAAREAGLDFLISTDHNTVNQKAATDDIDIPGFLSAAGNEVTAGWGHLVVYNMHTQANSLYTLSAQNAIDTVKENGGIAYIAHPFYYPYDWHHLDVTNYDGIEVWNYGAPDYANEMAFTLWDNKNKEGAHVYGIANSDAHDPRHVGKVKIKMYMEELSESAFYKGLKNGTFFGSNGPELSFSAGVCMMGSDYLVEGKNTSVTFTVGGEYDENITHAKLIVNGEVKNEWTPNAKSFQETVTVNVSPGDFVRFTLEAGSEKFAFSNPIFIVQKTGSKKGCGVSAASAVVILAMLAAWILSCGIVMRNATK